MVEEIEFLKNRVEILGNARKGSLGEFVFCRAAKLIKVRIEAVHDNRIDFLFDGEPVDVKTTSSGLRRKARPLGLYRGERYPGVKYGLVEFLDDGVRVSLEGKLIHFFCWTVLQEFWTAWARNRPRYDQAIDVRVRKKEALAPINAELREFFEIRSLCARIIYRTTSQVEWGKESLDNFKPGKVTRNGVTVYIHFKSSWIDRENVKIIYAFPDTSAEDLPMVERVFLHKPKVDLDEVPAHFVFQSVDDLKKRWRSIDVTRC